MISSAVVWAGTTVGLYINPPDRSGFRRFDASPLAPPDTRVAALIEDENEREIVLAYINKGEFIGEMGLFTPQTTRSVIVRTRVRCRVAEITYKRLSYLLDNELKDHAKELLYAIGAQLSQRLRSTSSKVGHLAFLDVTGRIAGTLLDLCKGRGKRIGACCDTGHWVRSGLDPVACLKTRSLYVRVGDTFARVCLALVVGLGLLQRFRRKA